MQKPAYSKLHNDGILQERTAAAFELMRVCRLCPRECHVDRLSGKKGFCETGRRAIVASFSAHFGEEAPLVGRHGSGTIFFSSCNLLCTFCQNYDISHHREGREITPEQLAAIMIRLADGGCRNINFVTPTHVVPQILEALDIAVEHGLDIPLVYNTGGYDRVETLKLLDGVMDVYMPDFKFWDARWADRFCNAPDYRERATEALREMHRQVGNLTFDSAGLAVKGLLVRHLVMPGGAAGTMEVMNFLAKEISADTYVNIMDQYRPCHKAGDDRLINRTITGREYEMAIEWAGKAGLTKLDPRAPIRRVMPL
jgi:putative pyruvate formate lyase activating enzyme